MRMKSRFDHWDLHNSSLEFALVLFFWIQQSGTTLNSSGTHILSWSRGLLTPMLTMLYRCFNQGRSLSTVHWFEEDPQGLCIQPQEVSNQFSITWIQDQCCWNPVREPTRHPESWFGRDVHWCNFGQAAQCWIIHTDGAWSRLGPTRGLSALLCCWHCWSLLQLPSPPREM